jgi:hypothetical protein
LNLEEFKKAVHRVKGNSVDAHALFSSIDSDGDGKLTLNGN